MVKVILILFNHLNHNKGYMMIYLKLMYFKDKFREITRTYHRKDYH